MATNKYEHNENTEMWHSMYEPDDGPLTDEQIAEIRKLSPVSDLPDDRMTARLFDIDTRECGTNTQN